MSKLADLIKKSKTASKEEQADEIPQTQRPKRFSFKKPESTSAKQTEKEIPRQETVAENVPIAETISDNIGQPGIGGFTQEELDEWTAAFDILKSNIENPEMVGNAIRIVANKIQQEERYRDILAPSDIGLMVTGLRNSYGNALKIKQGKANKRSERSQAIDKVAGNLADLEIKF